MKIKDSYVLMIKQVTMSLPIILHFFMGIENIDMQKSVTEIF